MDDYELLYDSEDFSVLLPNYISDSSVVSSEIREDESENGEDSERAEVSGDNNSFTIDDVYSSEVLISEQLDNLNNNICIMNDNIITLNTNVLYLIGVTALLLFFTLVNFALRIFNNTLGLGKV